MTITRRGNRHTALTITMTALLTTGLTTHSANAVTGCRITGMTPSTIVVGLEEISRKVTVTTSGCTVETQHLTTTSPVLGTQREKPVLSIWGFVLANADAGAPQKVTVTVTEEDTEKYAGYSGRTIRVQFKKSGTSIYTNVKNVTSKTGGTISTTVKATQSGTWRLAYGGNTATGSATSVGDIMKIR
jgi:hypothetical protein